MKNVLVTIILFLISYSAFSQHLLVLKDDKRNVIKVHLENGVSVYYSDWPDTTRNQMKAVLQKDVLSLTPIAVSDVDSVLTVVSKERDLREAAAIRSETKGFKKHKAYYAQKLMMGFHNEVFQYGMSLEAGMEVINKYRIGFGSGGERVYIDSIYAAQIPFFLSLNYTFWDIKKETQVYGLASTGYNFELNENDGIGNSRLFTVGIGVCFFNTIVLEMYYKSQKAEITYPGNSRANLIGINLGFLL